MGKQHTKIQSALSAAYFCKQLALLVKGGVSVPEAVAIIQDNTQDAAQKALYGRIAEAAKQGTPLAGALRQTGQLPAYMTQMIQIGETSGKLDDVLEALYVYYERTDRINRGVKNIVVYPVVMVCVMLTVIGVLLLKAVPIFAQVFRQAGADMPKYLQALSAQGGAAAFFIAVAGVAAVVVLAYLLLKYTRGGRALAVAAYENSFLTRKLSDRSNTNKFA